MFVNNIILNFDGLGGIYPYLYGVQVVGGSNPLAPTNKNKRLAEKSANRFSLSAEKLFCSRVCSRVLDLQPCLT